MLENVVQRQVTPEANRYKNLLLVLTVLIGLLMIAAPLLFPAFIAAVVMTVSFWKRLRSIEYEYTYGNGELSVDRITGGCRRKHCASININQAAQICRYDLFKTQGPDVRIEDYASGKPDARVYVICIQEHGKVREIIIEPDEDMLEAMKEDAPELVRR